MTIDEIKQKLVEQGKDPNDFNIKIMQNSYSYTPKWFYEHKKIAKQQDKPIKEDVDVVAETAVTVMSDVSVTAETVAQLMVEIQILKSELEALKNG